MSYSRKQGDTYPVRAQITDQAGIVDVSTADPVTLSLASVARRDVDAVVVAQSVGAPVAMEGENGWVAFPNVAGIAVLAPGLYNAEISFTIGGIIYTTDTFAFQIVRQLA